VRAARRNGAARTRNGAATAAAYGLDMAIETDSAADAGESPTVTGVELRLTVWTHGESGWHARIVAPDASEHEFASPFELARYLAHPASPPARPGIGLR
jgi:hypothetical protein